jgi:hypothetical protein
MVIDVEEYKPLTGEVEYEFTIRTKNAIADIRCYGPDEFRTRDSMGNASGYMSFRGAAIDMVADLMRSEIRLAVLAE